MVRWLRIRLPVQETQVPSLIREDCTCLGATSPCAPQLLSPCSRALEPQQEEPPQREARALQRRVAPAHHKQRKPAQQRRPCTAKRNTHVIKKKQKHVGQTSQQLAGDSCLSPILSFHRLRLREGKGPYLRSQPVLGERQKLKSRFLGGHALALSTQSLRLLV